MTDTKMLNPLAEMALVKEVVNQSKFAEIAAAKLAKSSDEVEIWSSIQSILIAAANISKILWPSRKHYMERGKHLRKLLSVDDDNLLSDRTFRDHFEHYDERIEDWFKTHRSSVYLDSGINPLEPTPFTLPQFFHRSYNPSSQILSFRNESIELPAVLLAISEIRKKCRFFALP